MRRYDILTGLDVCVDLILSDKAVPEFGQVEKLIDRYSLQMGGSAAIFACQCAKLGAKTLGLGVRGDDAFGELFEGELNRAGVDTRCVFVDPKQKTGLGVCLIDGDDRAILTYSGTIDALTPDHFTDELLKSARHLHIASFFLMPRLRPGLRDVLRRARALGLSVSLDTNWDPAEAWLDLEELLPLVDLFFPNEQERRALARYDELIAEIPVVVVKEGERGASAYLKDGRVFRAAAHRMPYVDAIGAGDSFDGGFITAWLQGLSIEACLEAGCACGSANVRRQGGTDGQLHYEELSEMLTQREVRIWPKS